MPDRSPSQFMERYEAATASHDLERTLGLIAEDAIYLFSDQTAHIGKSAIRQVLSANFASITEEAYRLDRLHWLATSDAIAACIYQFHWSGVIGGQPASGRGRGTSVLRNIGGEWLIAHEHLSAGKI